MLPACFINPGDIAIMTAPEKRDQRVVNMLDAVAGRVLGGKR
jgi:hypothetical protein